MGTFTYAQNILHAWSQVHVDTESLTVVSKGVEPETKEVVELYGITIKRASQVPI